MVGILVGDALGAPYEFYADRKRVYDGEMTLEPRIYNRHTQTFRSGVVGQITDDSEMTIVVARAIAKIISKGADPRETFIQGYLRWANSDTRMMGRNTRSLLKGVSTIRGYENRVKKIGLESQSNGPLMRALPFAFLPEELGDELALIATKLTNDNDLVRDTILEYFSLVRNLLDGIESETIKEELDAGFRGKNKGWIRYPLIYLHQSLQTYPLIPESLSKIADDIINNHRGCDSDTVLSIVFGVWCSLIGYKKLVKNQWFRDKLEIVIGVDTSLGGFPRPEIFSAGAFYGELGEIWKVFSSAE
jgi:hypothetical protein